MAYLRGFMMRSMVPLFALLSACTVGERPPDEPSGDRTTCEDRVATPMMAYNHATDPMGPRAGMTCLDGACHGAGGASTHFAFAGTAYKDSAAQAPAAGATVRIFQPGNDTALAEAVVDTAGNFIIRMPAMFTAFPYETHITACDASPNIKKMNAQVTAAEANCNLTGSCHSPNGGGAGVIDIPDPT